MFVKWSFTRLLMKQTRSRRAAAAKKDTKDMKSGSSVNCATSDFMNLVLKSKQHLSRSFSQFCNKVFMFM